MVNDCSRSHSSKLELLTELLSYDKLLDEEN